ncbi:MAG: SDR family oxidoreductase [Verrucomicrobiae bacterium]|nr:SDR family oxidoreductase [Verrucomicrobiae bacterium]
MASQSKSKFAVVTGANRGIGLEVARQLAAAGFHVFLTARDASKGKAAAAQLGKGAEFLELDVSNAKSISTFVSELSKRADHLDVLVNNAGVFPDHQTDALGLDPELLFEAFRTNTVGPFRLTQALVPLMEKADGARVINISSGLGALSGDEVIAPAYSVSKTALNAVTRQFAHALKPKRIIVNSVCPGWVRTDMGGPNAPRQVEQGADGIRWLATEAPASITGKFLRDRKVIDW